MTPTALMAAKRTIDIDQWKSVKEMSTDTDNDHTLRIDFGNKRMTLSLQ